MWHVPEQQKSARNRERPQQQWSWWFRAAYSVGWVFWNRTKGVLQFSWQMGNSSVLLNTVACASGLCFPLRWFWVVSWWQLMLARTLFQNVKSSSSIGRFHKKFPVLQVSVPLCLPWSSHVLVSSQSQGNSSKTSTQSPTFSTSQILSTGTLWCPPLTWWRVTETASSKSKFHPDSGQASRHIHHLPLLAPLESEQKSITSWDKTGSGNILG